MYYLFSYLKEIHLTRNPFFFTSRLLDWIAIIFTNYYC